MKKLIILGTGGFAREVLWLIREINTASTEPLYKVLGFAAAKSGADFPKSFAGPPVLGDDAWVLEHLSAKDAYIVPAIGLPSIRKAVVERYQAAGFKAATLVHPSVNRAPSLKLGEGSILCAGARLTVEVHIGQCVIVNLNATIGHDTQVGDFCTLHPGVNVSGNCRLGTGAELGSGAVMNPGVSIGEGALIGAGAVVSKNLTGGQTYVGVPARPIKK